MSEGKPNARRERFATTWGEELPVTALPPESGAAAPELPGVAPYTRGIHPTGYRGRLWTMRQYAGFASAAQTNERYRTLLALGQTGLSMAFDLPTQMGYDSDHPLASGEVGKVGVAIPSVEDLAEVFAGIDLERVTTSMTINATAPILLAMLVVVAEERGIDRRQLGGTVQNDLLKEYIARGTYIYPPEPSLRLVADLITWCAAEMPRWNPISISGYHIREAGSTAAQELAFTLANGLEYVQRVVARGMDVDAFAGRLSFFFNAHNNLFEEVAKLRAARRLWCKLLAERFTVRDPRSTMMRFHVQTAGSTLTSRQPRNNVVRVAYQALAAVLGGCQSLHTNACDEALGLPTEDSATLALRTQQILAEETGVADVVDPLGGSYLVERLTDSIEAAARDLIAEVERQGGVVAALERGFFQREIQAAAYRTQVEIEAGRQVVVGVNRHATADAGDPLEVFTPDPAYAQALAARLGALRAARAPEPHRRALAQVAEAARRSDRNLLPPILDAVRARATLGEIAATLEGVFGRHRG